MNDASTLGDATPSADRGERGDPVPVLARSRQSAVTSLQCCHAVGTPHHRAVAVLAALHLVVALGFAVRRRAPRPGASRIALAVVPVAPALSVLIVRRPDGAVVGVLLGLLVARRRPTWWPRRSWLQWLGADRPTRERRAWLVAVTAENAWWVLGTFALLLLYFPDGRLPSRRWRWVPPALVVCAVVGPGVRRVRRRRRSGHRCEDLDRPFGPAAGWSSVARRRCSSRCCCSSWPARCRWSCATGAPTAVQRQQIKWLALAGHRACRCTRCCACSRSSSGASRSGSAPRSASPRSSPPRSRPAIAVLRHDLYDVDKALALAVTWGAADRAAARRSTPRSRRSPGSLVGRDSRVGAARRHRGGRAAAAARAARACSACVDARMYPLRRAALAAVDELHREVSAGRARPEQLERRAPRGAARPRRCGSATGYPGSDAYLDAAAEPVPAERRARPARRRADRRARPAAPVPRRPSCSARSPTAAARWSRWCGCARRWPQALREAESSRTRLRRDRLRGAPPVRARPARRRPAAAGLARHGAAAGPAAPRRRHGRRRRAARRRAWPSSAPRSPSCARSPTGCGRAASTTGCRRRCRTWCAACR